MKKYLPILLLTLTSLAQSPTPNVGLRIPPTGSMNWYQSINFDFSRIDSIFGGIVPVPALSITNNLSVGGTITAAKFAGISGAAFPTVSGTPVSGHCPYWVDATTLGDTNSPCGNAAVTGLTAGAGIKLTPSNGLGNVQIDVTNAGIPYPAGSGIPIVNNGGAWGVTVNAPVGALVGTTDTQSLTNKTIDGVSPLTLSYLDATSSVQTQINGKAASNASFTLNGQNCALGGSCTVGAAASAITGTTLAIGVTSAPGLTSVAGGTFGSAAFTNATAYDASGAAATAQANAQTYAANANNLSTGTVNLLRLPGSGAITVNGASCTLGVACTLSASSFTTGTLPHAQLPALLSVDIPNNAANTSGQAGTVGTISGLLIHGTNTTITGTGTAADPYVVNSTASGTGSVTNVAATGYPSVLGTLVVTNQSTTPTFTFSAPSAPQNSVLAGPATGGAGAPTYQTAPSISAANMVSFPTLNQDTTGVAANVTGVVTASHGGTGTSSLTGLRYANGTLADSAASSSQIQSAIGSGIYDASGAAATAQSNAQTYASNASNLSSGTVGAARLPAATTSVQGAVVLPTGALNNVLGTAAIAPSTMTVNGITCTLGSTCSVGGGLSGSGTAGYYSTFSGASALGNGTFDYGLAHTGANTSSVDLYAPNFISTSSISVGTAHNIYLSGPSLGVANLGSTNGATDGTLNLAAINVSGVAAAHLAIASTSVAVASGSQGANSCSVTTDITMSGLTTSMVLLADYGVNPSALNGWGSTGGMVFHIWPSAANTATWNVCNQTGASISYGAISFNVGVR